MDAAEADAFGPCCGGRFRLLRPRLFLTKTVFVVLASYAFLPLIAAHNAGRVSAVAYACILVALHLGFVAVYFYRVRFRDLDGDWRSLGARLLGLVCCVFLLALVASSLPKDMGMLSVELLGLCAVHTLILALLMVEVRLDGGFEEADAGAHYAKLEENEV